MPSVLGPEYGENERYFIRRMNPFSLENRYKSFGETYSLHSLIPYSSGHHVVLKHMYIFRSNNSCNVTCQKIETGKFISLFGITPN